jgi:hypothetical protein
MAQAVWVMCALSLVQTANTWPLMLATTRALHPNCDPRTLDTSMTTPISANEETDTG